MNGERDRYARRDQTVVAKLDAIQRQTDAIQRQSDTHEREDNRRFDEISARLTGVAEEVRRHILELGKQLTETISGDSRTEGFRERLRNLTATDVETIKSLEKLSLSVDARFAKLEENRRWLIRMLASSTVGWILTMIGGLIMFFLSKRHG